jgi:hypothetical protein
MCQCPVTSPRHSSHFNILTHSSPKALLTPGWRLSMVSSSSLSPLTFLPCSTNKEFAMSTNLQTIPLLLQSPQPHHHCCYEQNLQSTGHPNRKIVSCLLPSVITLWIWSLQSVLMQHIWSFPMHAVVQQVTFSSSLFLLPLRVLLLPKPTVTFTFVVKHYVPFCLCCQS